jgi:hypothetical protein
MGLIRWSVVAGILVAAAACGDSTAPESSARFGDIRLTAAASSREVASGSPLTFQVELVNEGSSAMTLHFGDSCQIVATMQNALGQTVISSGACLTVLTQLTLAPGQPVVKEYVWAGGSTAFQPGEPPPSLPAGSYFFTVKVPANEASLSVTIQVTLR